MPLLTNSIKTFTFDDLVGALPLRQEKLEIFTRPGIDGPGARKLGQQGGRSTLKTVRFCEDWQDAEDTLVNYQELPGQNAVAIVRNSINHGTFLIVSVREVKVQAVSNAVGTLVTDPQVRLECEWTVTS